MSYENKEKAKENKRQYRLKNKEKLFIKRKEWERKNIEHIKEYQKKYQKIWYQKNKEIHDKKGKLWSKNPENKKKAVQYVLKSRAKHKNTFEEYQNKFNKTAEGKYRTTKFSAKKREYEFELSFEEFKEIISKLCSYCGENNKPRGIDRIDNSLGYTKENSAPCCKNCNYMKKKLSVNEFLSHIKKIYEFNN